MTFTGEEAQETRENEYHDARMRVDPWIEEMDRTGKVDEIDLNLGDLQKIFEFKCGANFEISESERSSLKKYSQGGSRSGMEAIWSGDRYRRSIRFCKEWVEKFELVEGNKELPKLKKTESGDPSSESKISGMLQFFHELTLFAKGDMSLEDFTKVTEIRLFNGKVIQEGRRNERKTMVTPTSGGKEKRIGGIPPGFVSDFYKWLLDSGK